MAAQIPIKDDPKANEVAMANVRTDKLREVKAGHDGTWVAHPALAAIAADVFNAHMPTPNQLYVRLADVEIAAKDLLNMDVPGRITEDGIRKNLSIGLGYMEGWLRGVGCVPINYLMVRRPARQTSGISPWTDDGGTRRRTRRRPKSVAVSCGSGAITACARQKASRSTRPTC